MAVARRGVAVVVIATSAELDAVSAAAVIAPPSTNCCRHA
jgi:hypothetical protein